MVDPAEEFSIPELITQTFEILTIKLDQDSEPSPSGLQLQPFKFESATLERQGAWFLSRWVIRKQRQQARQWVEKLGNDIELEMVAIPAGTFTMGSPRSESGHDQDEGPQHQVNVPAFLMGKYAITQAQWKAVAALPQVNRGLKPDPSHFKGSHHPVEQVSWLETVEFCDRLSRHTERDYRLPSEAEWEYACCAGTITPFYCGKTISTELANYYGESTYNNGPKGVNRQKTTPVGSFPANAFGLYDMHGNVWEWCLDHWHETYEGAPTDGSIWLSENDNGYRILRGGSWGFNPEVCRSAYRGRYDPGLRNGNIGFRVVLPAPRTLW